jgi:XTP/dITP diphosphohydrolase
VTRTVLASANPGKLRELTQLLAPFTLELVPQAELGVTSVEESGTTFVDNALLKARHAAAATQLAALADDSGLEVDALGGRPGVWSARYAGVGASDADNLRHLLAQLSGVPAAQRQARYQCVIVFLPTVQAVPLIARGTWEGHIAGASRGTGGFGYDPVFVPAGGQYTAAELDSATKNAVSHRGQALHALVAILRQQGYIRAP